LILSSQTTSDDPAFPEVGVNIMANPNSAASPELTPRNIDLRADVILILFSDWML
jgi:hypothetical protein